MDLRYGVPLVINLFRYYFFQTNADDILHNFDDHLPILNITATPNKIWVIVAIIILVFLFTSIKLSLTTHDHQPPLIVIQVLVGEFSGPLAISLAASTFLPQPHYFWVNNCIIIVCVSPLFGWIKALCTVYTVTI